MTLNADVFLLRFLLLDQSKIKITGQDASKALEEGTPSIIAGGRGNTLNIGVVLLRPEQVEIVAGRVREILQKALI